MTGARDEAYAALGLPPGAPFEEVRKRFLSLATQLHPEKAPGAAETAQFSAVRCVCPTRALGSLDGRGACAPPQLATRRMMGGADGDQTDTTHAAWLVGVTLAQGGVRGDRGRSAFGAARAGGAVKTHAQGLRSGRVRAGGARAGLRVLSAGALGGALNLPPVLALHCAPLPVDENEQQKR